MAWSIVLTLVLAIRGRDVARHVDQGRLTRAVWNGVAVCTAC